jgi:cell wall-associated protease
MHKLPNITVTMILLLLYSFCNAQSGAIHPAKRPHDWWQADWKKDSLPGISLEQAYEYLKGRKSKPVIVAIIGESLDINHNDLKNSIWTNKKEIPGNGIDDDHNGYVDDMHGWNFVANKNNVYRTKQLSLEASTYITWRKKFNNIDTSTLKGTDKAQYDNYILAKSLLFDRLKIYYLGSLLLIDTATLTLDSAKFIAYLDNLLPLYKDTMISKIPFGQLPFRNTYDSAANQLFATITKNNHDWDYSLGAFDSSNKYQQGYISYFVPYALKYNKTIIDDTLTNYRAFLEKGQDNFNNRYYGTPDINIPSSDMLYMSHSTMIAGIIAAKPSNDNGIKGIAINAFIMQLSTSLPNGGSENKDIINAIYYAVNNGAEIINISLRPTGVEDHVKELRAAFDYADKHHVIIVGGAGNDGENINEEKYLIGQGSDGLEHDSYLRVGATTNLLNERLIDDASNFGDNTVDVFAPGTDIYSTAPFNEYAIKSGTSLACPMVAGIVALLKSYFPTLTAKQIKKIIMKSVYKPDVMVLPPTNSGITNKVPFSSLSKSSGIVNAYNAVKLADEMTSHKK